MTITPMMEWREVSRPDAGALVSLTRNAGLKVIVAEGVTR